MNQIADTAGGHDVELYVVVINHEEQYSIWPAWRERPLGWDQVGEPATRDQCLDWIEKNWTDMRPKSLRAFMDGEAGSARVTHDD